MSETSESYSKTLHRKMQERIRDERRERNRERCGAFGCSAFVCDGDPFCQRCWARIDELFMFPAKDEREFDRQRRALGRLRVISAVESDHWSDVGPRGLIFVYPWEAFYSRKDRMMMPNGREAPGVEVPAMRDDAALLEREGRARRIAGLNDRWIMEPGHAEGLSSEALDALFSDVGFPADLRVLNEPGWVARLREFRARFQ